VTPLEVSADSVVLNGHQDATQSDLREIAFKWLTAWDARDGDALISLFHEDAVMHLPGAPYVPFGGTHFGRDAIRRANDLAWATARTTPEPMENYAVIASGNVVILQGYKGIRLPDGRVVQLWGYHLITVQDGLIVDFRAEYDTLKFAEIVGLPPLDARPGSSR
jgi:ketosteroid isomerase-like protein